MRRWEVITLLAGAAAGVRDRANGSAAEPRDPRRSVGPGGARLDRGPELSPRCSGRELHIESVAPFIEELVRLPAEVIVESGATIVSRLAQATRTVQSAAAHGAGRAPNTRREHASAGRGRWCRRGRAGTHLFLGWLNRPVPWTTPGQER